MIYRITMIGEKSRNCDRLLLGYHIKTTPTIYKGIEKIRDLYESNTVPEYGIAVQIFTKAPRQFARSVLPNRDDLAEIQRYCRAHDIFIVIHGIYLVNFINYDTSEKARISIIEDLKIVEQLAPDPGSTGVVVHLGKNTRERPVADCIRDFVHNIETCLKKAPGKSRILLETSIRAKNGRDLFHNIDNLGLLYQAIPKRLRNRIGFCVDSCHVYSSGYDVSNPHGFRDFIEEWDKKIGADKIMLFHLNDSRLGLGSNRDLHEEIGRGTMFRNDRSLTEILSWCKHRCVPVVLETGGIMDREFPQLAKVMKKI